MSVNKVVPDIWVTLGEDGVRRAIWNDARVKYPKEMEMYSRKVEETKSGS